MTSSSSSSLGIDNTFPSTARMYDYWPGGHDNFAADPAAALKVSEAAPEVQPMAVENRRFLRQAVRYLGYRRRGSSSSWTSVPGCPPGTMSTRSRRTSTPPPQ